MKNIQQTQCLHLNLTNLLSLITGKLKTVPLKESNVERKREGEKGGGREKEGKEQRKERQKLLLIRKQAWQEGHKKTRDKPEKQVCFYQE